MSPHQSFRHKATITPHRPAIANHDMEKYLISSKMKLSISDVPLRTMCDGGAGDNAEASSQAATGETYALCELAP